MQRIRFGIVGAGWRSEFFQRAAAEAPARFEMVGAVVRDPEKGAAFEKKWDRPSFRTIDAMLSAGSPRFVVVCVKWAPTPEVISALAERGVPALSETPPAPDLAGLVALNERADRGGWKVQVAEQYPFQPHHAARLSVARSGLLGTVAQAQVSCAHGYHGVSLLRRFLGVRFEEAEVVAREFVSPLLAAAERADVVKAARRDAPKHPPADGAAIESKQTLAWFDFGGRLGVFDFAKGQYDSRVRNPRILVRGERGEILGDEAFVLKDGRTPLRIPFERVQAGERGNLEGHCLQGIQFGDRWAWENPVAPARLFDDEIAVATCLLKMDEYVETGRDFYSLAEASQDHYLSILANRAAKEKVAVRAERQPWARA